MNNSCYRFEKRYYSDGIFNESIDATYILHLEQNGRLKSINEQLEMYHPTNVVYILFNKGYKKCEKENVDDSVKDLIDAFLFIFKDANEKQYNNILILEDDFIFSPKIKETTHINNINDFLNKSKNSDIQYLIGTIPWIRVPYIFNNNHSIMISSLGTHSVVYTKSNRERILQEPKDKLKDWDVYSTFNNICYGYHIPLCYQLFPETENRKKWGYQNPIYRLFGITFVYIFDYIGLDKSVEPGYSYLYFFSLILFYIILCIILILVFFITRIVNRYVIKKGSYQQKKSFFGFIFGKK